MFFHCGKIKNNFEKDKIGNIKTAIYWLTKDMCGQL